MTPALEDLRERIARPAAEQALRIPFGLCPADCDDTRSGPHAHDIRALLDAHLDAVLDALGLEQVGWLCAQGELSAHPCDDDDEPVFVLSKEPE